MNIKLLLKNEKMKKQLLSVTMLGILGLGLAGCGGKNEVANSNVNTESEEVVSNNESSEEINDESTEETNSSDKRMSNEEIFKKFKFADFEGSYKDALITPEALEAFQSHGYVVNIHKEVQQAFLVAPCYDENGEMYSNICVGQYYIDLNEGEWNKQLGTFLVFRGLNNTIKNSIVQIGQYTKEDNKVVPIEMNGDMWFPVDTTENIVKDKNGKEFDVNYDERDLVNAEKVLEEEQ